MEEVLTRNASSLQLSDLALATTFVSSARSLPALLCPQRGKINQFIPNIPVACRSRCSSTDIHVRTAGYAEAEPCVSGRRRCRQVLIYLRHAILLIVPSIHDFLGNRRDEPGLEQFVGDKARFELFILKIIHSSCSS